MKYEVKVSRVSHPVLTTTEGGEITVKVSTLVHSVAVTTDDEEVAKDAAIKDYLLANAKNAQESLEVTAKVLPDLGSDKFPTAS